MPYQLTTTKRSNAMKWLQKIGLNTCLVLGLTAVGINSSLAQQAPKAPEAKTELLWLGQAGFRINTPGGKTIVIDPWITGVPKRQLFSNQTSPHWAKLTCC